LHEHVRFAPKAHESAASRRATSALPLKANIAEHRRYDRNV
jgi:hypothetical protein